MAKIPTSTQTSLWQRLTSHAEQRWPQIDRIGTNVAFGMLATSISLSSGGKYRSVVPGMT